ncbi:MAG TPA: hypothetical protein VJS89_07310 [Gammaproteobacteria bacterium]|nr:hypothetical protein [Gammaproteobacteria bacterium]
MSPAALLYTAGLMGLLALAGGGYGGFYTLNKLHRKAGLLYAAFTCYAAVLALAVLIAGSTPLAIGWKILIVVSALTYAAVPPATCRFLVKLHEPQRQQS